MTTHMDQQLKEIRQNLDEANTHLELAKRMYQQNSYHDLVRSSREVRKALMEAHRNTGQNTESSVQSNFNR